MTNVLEMVVAELRKQKFKWGQNLPGAHEVCEGGSGDRGEQGQQRAPLHPRDGAHPIP